MPTGDPLEIRLLGGFSAARGERSIRLPTRKRLEEFHYQHQTSITERQVNQLLDFRFLDERANLVFMLAGESYWLKQKLAN